MSALIDIRASELAGDGYCVLPGALDRSIIEALSADLAASFSATPGNSVSARSPYRGTLGASGARRPDQIRYDTGVLRAFACDRHSA